MHLKDRDTSDAIFESLHETFQSFYLQTKIFFTKITCSELHSYNSPFDISTQDVKKAPQNWFFHEVLLRSAFIADTQRFMYVVTFQAYWMFELHSQNYVSSEIKPPHLINCTQSGVKPGFFSPELQLGALRIASRVGPPLSGCQEIALQ